MADSKFLNSVFFVLMAACGGLCLFMLWILFGEANHG